MRTRTTLAATAFLLAACTPRTAPVAPKSTPPTTPRRTAVTKLPDTTRAGGS